MFEFNIDYSQWSNPLVKRAVECADTDDIFGLSKEEVSVFVKKAEDAGFETDMIDNLVKSSLKEYDNGQLAKAIDYFNKLSYYERSDVMTRTGELGYQRCSKMEQDYNSAFEQCEAYKLIKARPDRFEDKIRFDFQEVHDDVDKALKSLNELKDKLQKIIENANGVKKHTIPEMTQYDLDEIANRILGMSYEEFINSYDLEFTKSTTINDLNNEQKIIYDKARAYVKEIKKLARDELQNTRWDWGEKLSDETRKYSDASVQLVDYTDEDYILTENAIDNLSSGIVRESFKEALFEKYNATGINLTQENEESPNGKFYNTQTHQVEIIKDGQNFDLNGKKRK